MKKESQLDRFAETIAELGDTGRVAKRMAVTPAYANAMMQRLRKVMGPQAI